VTRIRRPLGLLAALVVALPLSLGAAPATPVEDLICDPIDPAACLLPWPNDFFTVPDGYTDTGRRVSLNPAAMPRNVAGVPIDPTDYNRNDGFSPGALIVTKVPGLDTPEAFAQTNPPPITNPAASLDLATSPVVVLNASTGQAHPVWVELERARDLDGNPPSAADTTLLVRPAVNFEEGTRYIVALRNLKDAAGSPIPPQAGFQRFLDGQDTSARQVHYDSAIFPALAGAGIAKNSLYLAWDFTVASKRNLFERMLTIRDDAFGQLGDDDLGNLVVEGDSPTFVVNEVIEQLPCRPEVRVTPACRPQQLDSRLSRRVEGYVIVPCYLNQPGCPAGSRFLYADPTSSIPVRIPGNTTAARFICNIPANPAAGKFRPSLNGHGLLGTAYQVNDGKLYDLGDDGLMFCATDWIGMAQEDIPNDVSLLADLGRFSTLADRVQQGMLNFLYLGRAMIHPNGFGSHPAFQVGGQSVIDTTRLYYYGGSQGGIIGGSLTAVAPDFTRAHLGVPGMNYSTLLRRSTDFDDYAAVMYPAYPNELERPLILSLVQMLWDRAESNGYAHHMTSDPYDGNTPAHEVLLTEAFGDHQVTNWATEVMARTVGASLRVPALDALRHPSGANAYWGIPAIASYPFAGSALVVADLGPLRACPVGFPGGWCDGGFAGTNAPPTEEVPNYSGVDPHGPDWSEDAQGMTAIANFLSPNGWLVSVCGTHPCYMAGWTGP
jgi:hypothetical protein